MISSRVSPPQCEDLGETVLSLPQTTSCFSLSSPSPTTFSSSELDGFSNMLSARSEDANEWASWSDHLSQQLRIEKEKHISEISRPARTCYRHNLSLRAALAAAAEPEGCRYNPSRRGPSMSGASSLWICHTSSHLVLHFQAKQHKDRGCPQVS